MHETIQEYVSAGAGCRVDRGAGVIRGVKILGLESRNRRTYLPEALRRAASLYEGAKVNVNHPKGSPNGPRDYQDRIGLLRNVRLEQADGGLRGDFHFNPKHALAEQLIWDAEHSPENVGFSHNVEARTNPKNGRAVVEEIIRVQSVDLVADPATTRGLFEQTESTADAGPVVASAEDFVAVISGRPTAAERADAGKFLQSTGEESADFAQLVLGQPLAEETKTFVERVTC